MKLAEVIQSNNSYTIPTLNKMNEPYLNMGVHVEKPRKRPKPLRRNLNPFKAATRLPNIKPAPLEGY
jgi:hypothetical protein